MSCVSCLILKSRLALPWSCSPPRVHHLCLTLPGLPLIVLTVFLCPSVQIVLVSVANLATLSLNLATFSLLLETL